MCHSLKTQKQSPYSRADKLPGILLIRLKWKYVGNYGSEGWDQAGSLISPVRFYGVGQQSKRETILQVTRRLAVLESGYFVVNRFGQAVHQRLICFIDMEQIGAPGYQDGDLNRIS